MKRIQFFAKNYWIFSALLITGNVSADLPKRDNALDALSLAIQAFNPKHDKLMNSKSPEQKFMAKMLNSLDEKLPQLLQIRRENLRRKDENWYPFENVVAFAEVGQYLDYDLAYPEPKVLERIKTAQETLHHTFGGCPQDITVQTGKLRGDRYVKEIRYIFDNPKNLPLPATCSPTVFQTMKKLGIRSLRSLVLTSNNSQRFTFYFVAEDKLSDMLYISKQLKAIPELAPIKDELEVSSSEMSEKPQRNPNINVSTAINVMSVGADKSLTLRFDLFWHFYGKKNHVWIVKATPVGESEVPKDFTIQLQSESGETPPTKDYSALENWGL